MAQEQQKSRTARMLLENGTDPDGNVKYVNQTLGVLSNTASDWNGDKAIAIVSAVAPCLDKTVGGIESVVTYAVSAS